MARTYTVLAAAETHRQNLVAFAGEPLEITVEGLPAGAATALTIGPTAGGAAVVEALGDEVIEVTASLMALLSEGTAYRYNVWRQDAPVVVAYGDLDVRPSMAPSGATPDPGGGGGSAGTYQHAQPTPAATWIINHDLGRRPAVELYSTGWAEIDAAVTHVSSNQVVVTFNSPTAGFALCI